MEKSFTDKESGEKFVLEELQKKYNQTFMVDKEKEDSEKFQDYPTKNVYTCVVYPENKSEEKVSVWASDKGEMNDNYATYYFK